MGTESLRTYNKLEPSSFSTKDKIFQIIVLSALLLWLVVYEIETINFYEYDGGPLIKAALYVASFFFIVSILLGVWAYYKIKSVCFYNNSTEIMNAVKWFAFGLFVFMISIPHIFFPESDRFFNAYLIALTYAGKHVMGKISKNPE